ncbi:Uu.00g042620.m01.CDS01 [Anthostomella pinea]|uniref:Uu.00g042620.m01.CDS01 n=1 Tax=Anthostomella pinea TaxID=933095 RepID=A0AAI8VAK3_9PEZI|nr:Uu.00g042620.m01.CDS01 [Anthostomella pinea]
MYAQAALAVLGLASTAAATYHPSQLNSLRDLNNKNGLAARQDDSDSSSSATGDDGISDACTTSAYMVLASIPTPTGDLSAYLSSFVATADLSDVTDAASVLCDVTAGMPTSLSSAYSSYDMAASSWYSSNSADIQSLISSCAGDMGAELTMAVSAVESYTSSGCSGSVAAMTSGLTSSSTGSSKTSGSGSTGGATATSSGASTSVETGAASRPTGLIAGAVAAAGFLGAAVML